ncbi:hypothetical protein PLESTB_001095400 [Pleodorina starrii]|uniref:Uncharacterized protein n=1 Tax=Pleodorina starrii TaxID=330485 RepID=A0A9W6BQ59_9CHLO|nr:hypothetical protein PLESTB_001095400 [Pleodorina starrii]
MRTAPEKESAIDSLAVLAFAASDSALVARSGDVDDPQASGGTTFPRAPDHDRVTVTLGTAASLPTPGMHAHDGLHTMVAGLSSPCFHNTLAAPHQPGRKSCMGAPCGSAATVAATTAFMLSMAWAGDPTVQCLGDGGGFHHACIDPCPASDLIGAISKHRVAEGASASPRWPYQHQPTAAAQPSLGTATAARLLAVPSLSTRRGLYEGTVRGGCVRNTWRYLNTRTLAG